MDSNRLPPMEIFTDGSCFHNEKTGNGAGGLGYVIRYWVMENDVPTLHEVEGSRGFKLTTNNRMEVMAAIASIKDVLDGVKTGRFSNVTDIRMFSDSQYLCDAISKNWLGKWISNEWKTMSGSSVKNRDLWEQVNGLLTEMTNSNIRFTISHVYGHNGNDSNEKADSLAVAAAKDVENHESDKFYEDLKGR